MFVLEYHHPEAIQLFFRKTVESAAGKYILTTELSSAEFFEDPNSQVALKAFDDCIEEKCDPNYLNFVSEKDL